MKEKAVKSASTIDVYDFDHTIYYGDSSLDFYFFCIRNKPSLLKYLPYQFWHTLLFIAKLEPRTRFKSDFFIFLRDIDTASYVNRFWDGHSKKVKSWYIKGDHSKDVIISASPDFLLRPLCDELQTRALIATKMNSRDGKIEGNNCRGKEKVRRLHEEIKNPTVRKVYSDSVSDMPILSLAEEPYIVFGDKIVPLVEYKKISTTKRFLLGLHVLKFW